MPRELTPSELMIAIEICQSRWEHDMSHCSASVGACPSCRSAILALVDGDGEQVPEDDLCEDCLEQKATEFFETVPNQRCKDCTIKMLEEVCERMRADMPVAPDDPAAVGCVAMILRDYANEKDVERAARIVKVFAAPSGQGVGEAWSKRIADLRQFAEDARARKTLNGDGTHYGIVRMSPDDVLALCDMVEGAALATPPAAPHSDTRRLDWLEGEIEREQEAIRAGGRLFRLSPKSLFRQNVPITRAAIDAAMSAALPAPRPREEGSNG